MESHKRSIAKALSWRLIAVCITTVTAYIFTNEVAIAVSVGAADSAAKLLTYYGHERLWERVPFGREEPTKDDYEI